MPPLLYLVRHGEAESNIDNAWHIRDAVLTEKGISQCGQLRDRFQYHDAVTTIMSSPLRRALQTAAFAFGPALSRPDVKFLLIPLAQELSEQPCDVGHSRADLQQQLPELLREQLTGFDPSKIDLSLMEEGWNSKTGIYVKVHGTIQKRAALLRSWLFDRPEASIVLVTHGAFLHYLTEDWTGDDPVRGTAYLNCEHRIFKFTDTSTAQDAHIVETEESKSTRSRAVESDPTILAEMEDVKR